MAKFDAYLPAYPGHTQDDFIMKFSTKAIHIGSDPEPNTGAVIPPIFQVSTFVQDKPGEPGQYNYSRLHNPTRENVEKAIAALEDARYGICFSSGIAAVNAVVKQLKAGEDVVVGHDLYGGTYRIFEEVYRPAGIGFSYVAMHDLEALEAAITHSTRAVWLETPSNPTLWVSDIQAIAQVCKDRGLLLCVDNTLASPYLQNPLAHGADIVVHSATKYLGGHSDIVMGALALNDESLYERLLHMAQAGGSNPGPFDCFLLHRGLKTLSVRVRQQCENAAMVAQFLKEHPKVNRVLWPGLPDHFNHEVAKKQMHDFGGMVSFDLKKNSTQAAAEWLGRCKFFKLAVSLGSVESLASCPAVMTHEAIPEALRKQAGISDSLIRLSVGIEDIHDLLQDLEHAFR